MPPSETSIANGALTLLGERRIESLDAPNKRTAKLLSDRYPEVRDEVLRMHGWNFAMKRASLAEDTEMPEWGFEHQYRLPEDLLRLVNVANPADIDYRVEGPFVLTDLGAPLQITYTRQVIDPTEMDVLFRQALSAALAADLAEVITGTTSKVEDLIQIRDAKISAARVPNGQENRPREIQASEWLDSREEGFVDRRTPSAANFPGTPL